MAPLKIFLQTILILLVSTRVHTISTVPFLHYLFSLTANENKNENFTELANKYGKESIEYNLVTEDNYILDIFRVPGDVKQPVILVHGLMTNGNVFFSRGKKSLAYTLSEAGYDVWICNYRGTRYGRKHATLDPENDSEFWDYSFEEIGYYDVPACIDFVLEKTGQTELQAIGYSQGSTAFYVLGSMKPEYNEKIKILIALAPIAHFNHIKDPLITLFEKEQELSNMITKMGKNYLFGSNSEEKSMFDAVCWRPIIGYTMCTDILFRYIGYDEEELEPEFYYTLKDGVLDGVSKKNGQHLLRLARGFTRFDYGEENNLQVYNSTAPPIYELNKVNMKIALFVAKNDKLSTIEDAKELQSELPNVVEFRILKRKKLNHLGFIFGKNMNVYLFPHILATLEKHRDSKNGK